MDLGRTSTSGSEGDTEPVPGVTGTIDADGSSPSTQGTVAGAFVQLGLKSLIWYPVPEFQQADYSIPETWDDLVGLSQRMVSDGRTPWCMGWRTPGASGWPGTDWIENLLLAGAGPAAYDAWTVHDLPFDSPPVREAFERLGRIVFADGFVDGGPAAAARRLFEDAQTGMVTKDPPKCWLYQFPGFASSFIPSKRVPDTAFFPFPRMTGASTQGMLGGGILVGAFSDRPEVREVVRFLLGPQFGEDQVQHSGAMSPNRGFDVENYPVVLRPTAEALKASLAADSFRFDASTSCRPRSARTCSGRT